MKKIFTLFLLINSALIFGQWTASMVIPTNVCQHGLVAHPNGNVYLFSGWNGLGPEVNAMYIYNTATNTWTTGPSVPYTARGVAYCLGTDNMVYCLAGYPVISTFARFDVATSTWSTLASCPNGNWEGSMVSYNNKIYYAGGETVETSMRIYDIALGTWSTGANLPVGVKLHKIASGNNGNLYVFGGHLATNTATNTVQRYNIAADTWSVIGTMPAARNQFGASLAPDGRIYLVGGKTSGSNNGAPFFNNVDIFNPCSNTWTVGFAHPVNHGELAVTSTTNGLFAMGGTSGSALNINYFLPVTPGSLAFPNITFTPAASQICAGSSATIGVSGASTYTWNTGSNSTALVVTPSVNTSYSVVGTSSTGCTNVLPFVTTVTVNALPTLSATSNSSLICVGQNATLTAAGANTYTWSTTSNSTSIVVSPSVSSTYTISGTNANGCSNSTTITQSVSLCTGIASVIEKDVTVGLYPNPTNGLLNIALSSLSENVSIELYSNMGQLILSQKINSLTSDLNLENTANGIYSIRITENGKAVFTSKIVKQ